jgi:iron complex outermembrane recepter protein
VIFPFTVSARFSAPLAFPVLITFQRGRSEHTDRKNQMKKLQLLAAIFCSLTTLAHATDDLILNEVVVTATRFRDTVTNKPVNMTVITRDDINKSSAHTLPELLSEQSGTSVRDLYGNNAAGTTVDLRGFGATAGQNTLVLLDGKRITNIDSSGVQWSAIPFSAIERIEIMRGSGAALYGDGATGGVINIITKVASKVGAGGQVGAMTGSYGLNEVQANANFVTDKTGFDVSASHLSSDGYRNNNRNEQANGMANMRWLAESGVLALKAGVDTQKIRYPGARTVSPSAGINEVETDPRGTSTPLDHASRDGNVVGLDWILQLPDSELNIGLLQRNKKQKSYFYFSGYPSYRDSDLSVDSFTPSIKLPQIFGTSSTLVAGVDLHNWSYGLRTSNDPDNIAQPINRITMTQQNRAVYLQNTSYLTAATTLMAGLRNELISIRAADIYNAAAPGGSFGSGAQAGSFESSQNAYELGLRHQISSEFAISGRAGHSYRFANVDEIYESGGAPGYSREFQFLRPQKTDSTEIGVEQKVVDASWRATLFNNKVQDEIHLDLYTSGVGNTNLPPSERKGVELEGKWKALQQLSLRAAYTYTDARFQAGTEVPLVAKNKINLGATWSATEQTQLNAAVTHVGSQYMDNDEANTFGTKIPAYTAANFKLVHRSGAWSLSAAVNNVFDAHYFNYAVNSTSTPGKYNVYTLPGRTIFFGASYQM